MKISVLIPTYRRSNDLKRCLKALQDQQRPPDEVILIVRVSDTETQTFLNTHKFGDLGIKKIVVDRPGQVFALNMGLEATQGEIIAITDDDAAPHADWLKRIETHFQTYSEAGGVGGRDWVYWQNQLVSGKTCRTVGRVQFFGRVIGNHHLGVGSLREVEILKGANMSYRRTAITNIRFDERLLGQGAEVGNDMAFSLAVKRAGWKLFYDPLVAVNHYPAQRFDNSHRTGFNPQATYDRVYNETLILLDYLPFWRKILFGLWAVLMGTRAAPGFFQFLRLLFREQETARQKWQKTMKARWQALQVWWSYQTKPLFQIFKMSKT